MRLTILSCLAAALSAATLSACATAPAAPAGPPSFASIPTTPSTKAKLYADCIVAADAYRHYGRASDGDSELVLFTCDGPPAQRFYDALATRSAAVGSEHVEGGRTYRSTNAVRKDLFGVDYCSTDGSSYECVITLNAGPFLAD